MSKIARKPIQIPGGVAVSSKEGTLDIKGPKGALIVRVLNFTDVKIAEKEISVLSKSGGVQARANLGTMVALLKNALIGVSVGFIKRLEIEGIGFRASMEGKILVLNVGFTHQVKFEPSEGVSISVEKNVIVVTGIDKYLVGQTAALIRKIKKPEPYKGKGIHYAGEVIRRKAGKKVAGTGTGAA